MPRPALLLAVLLPAVSGCVWYGPASMTRVWADKNTLGRPAVFVERIEHLPPPRPQVETFRWQYGVGPGGPPPTATVPSPGPTPGNPLPGNPLPGPMPPDTTAMPAITPPPAPPASPALPADAMMSPPTPARPISRDRTAWLFARPRS